MGKYDAYTDEILFYGERDKSGRWIIPIEVDFDFTMTKTSQWKDGKIEPNELCFDVMRRFTERYNVGWILHTMRSGDKLDEPLRIIEEHGVKLYGIGENPCANKNKEQTAKIWAILSVDDRNIGTPLIHEEGRYRPYVDWEKVEELLTPILEEVSHNLDKVKSV